MERAFSARARERTATHPQDLAQSQMRVQRHTETATVFRPRFDAFVLVMLTSCTPPGKSVAMCLYIWSLHMQYGKHLGDTRPESMTAVLQKRTTVTQELHGVQNLLKRKTEEVEQEKRYAPRKGAFLTCLLVAVLVHGFQCDVQASPLCAYLLRQLHLETQ